MRSKLCTLALTGFFALGMASSAALAQDQTTPPPQQGQGMQGHHGMDPDQQLSHLTKKLDLSADQQSQIKPILESQSQQMQQVWQDQSTPREERHQKMMAIHQDSNQKIEAVLNDTQKQKFEAMQAQMKQHHQQGGPPPSSDSAPPAPQL